MGAQAQVGARVGAVRGGLRACAMGVAAVACAVGGAAQEPPVPVALVAMPYSGARNVPERSGGPGYLLSGGLESMLRDRGVALAPTLEVALTAEDEREYGEWHRMGLANGHLAEMVGRHAASKRLTVGLLANCTSVLGMLAGLQRPAGAEAPRTVALVFIDAHGDFNVPETTLSGMLGGMPVAVAAGMALQRLRMESRLDPPLPTGRIVMGAVRDLDPLERELVEASEIQHLSTDDLRHRPEAVRAQMERLSRLADVVYVHIDMDVLDPAEVPGHPLTVKNGPTSVELAGALEEMFRFEKVEALGIASTPWGERDPDGVSRRAAYTLVEGALRGVRARGGGR